MENLNVFFLTDALFFCTQLQFHDYPRGVQEAFGQHCKTHGVVLGFAYAGPSAGL